MWRSLVVTVVLVMAGTLFPGVTFDQDGAEGAQETLVTPLSTQAGSLGGAASEGEVYEFEAVADDGVALRGHVHVPAGQGPFATILIYSPYFNTWGTTTGLPLSGYQERFLDEGFAVALVNIRGTGVSQGCKAWFDASIDGPDVNAVIERIVSEPWSNGKVGMIGNSWPGYTQYAALYDPHPALGALVPSSSVLDLWSLMTRQGAIMTTQYGPSTGVYAAFTASTAVGSNMDQTNLDCPEYVDWISDWNELSFTGDKTEFMDARDNRQIIADADVPMWVTNGLIVFGEGHITQVEGLWELMGDNGRLILGQWEHQFPTLGDAWWDAVVAWFDQYLRDGPMLVEPGVAEYQDSATLDWHESDAWPPASDKYRFYLSDGSLKLDPGEVQESSQWFQGVNKNGLPEDCPGVQAMFVSPPLAEDVRLAGNFQVNLTVTSTLAQSNFGAFVYGVEEVGLCGTATIVTDPIHALQPADWVSQAVSTLQHRGHLETGVPFPTDEPDEMLMTSHPFARTLKAGERVVLVVTGGALEVLPNADKPQLEILTGPGLTGELVLPVVEGELRFAADGGSVQLLTGPLEGFR